MSPVVVRSLSDPSGGRCVDILRDPDGGFGWVECRRDPEDCHGWRHLSPPRPMGFPSPEAARADAARAVGWLEAEA